MDTPLIEFKKVSKRFDSRTILDGVDLTICEGEVTTIIGKSGVGKSVLLKHIIGLLQPDEGEILLHGRSIQALNGKEKMNSLGRISYMFQNNALFDALTVYDNIALPLRYTTRLDKKQIHSKVMERIEQTELKDVAYHYPADLSGGMQKRAALARALVIDPEIVLFDEPTTGQDPIRRNAILSMIAEYQHRLGFTAVLISHDLPDVFFISNRVIALYEGKVIYEGTPEGFDDFDHPFRYEFLHSLESLQEELTGLYTRRHFKIRYQSELHANPGFDTYAMVVFSLENLEEIQSILGHTAAQELVRTLGIYISKHFGDVGGFSTRYRLNQYTTLLPYSDIQEATALTAAFAEDFKENGIAEMRKFVRAEIDCKDAVAISMMAGVAQGTPSMNIETVVAAAGSNHNKILEFSARCKGSQT
jgi:phospholipid/cholesterol/gamma-HCH transport system ATP-binding protein